MDLKPAYKPAGSLGRSLLAKWTPPILVALVALLIGMFVMHAFSWDLSIPWKYPELPGDQVWQLTLTKSLLDNGWVLNSQYLGAPGVAHWYANPAAQTSGLHSILMLALSLFSDDAVVVQQAYFLLNFALIALTSFLACRLLGISRIPAAAAAVLFPFITFRFNLSIYAYLANYFAVPLALVPVYWILKGDYASDLKDGEPSWPAVRRVLGSRRLWLGALFVTLIALSDGYYAFFTLLLLGFAVGGRVVCGDFRRPLKLLAPGALIAILMTVALAMTWPLVHYKNTHPGEFYPNGVEDPALVKHAFEAEVYSSSLKLLLAPAPGIHRIPAAAELGQEMLESSNEARFFGGSDVAPLGLLASLLFLAALTLTVLPATGRRTEILGPAPIAERDNRLLWASVALSIFIFLCTISGGIGSLIALIFPSIRAYDRFAIFLNFVLYVGAGAVLTRVLTDAGHRRRLFYSGLLLLLCVLSLFDQVPANAMGSKVALQETSTRYLAERDFVGRVEASLPEGAMVYNYPYSQYMADSKYYGWGGFGHIRLYLHSRKLHWSNGGSKNSPVDDWHARQARLPASQLIAEMQGAGFRGMVIDRRVLKEGEYQRLSSALLKATGTAPVVDPASKLAFAKLDDPGYHLEYDSSYMRPIRLTVYGRKRTLAAATLPRLINRAALERALAENQGVEELVLDGASYPAVFLDPIATERGSGDYVILPVTDVKGTLQCSLASGKGTASIDDTVVLRLANGSAFDWQINGGKYPLRIGVNLYNLNGSLSSWDERIRVPGELSIPEGSTAEIRFPLALTDIELRPKEQGNYILQFALVQDGSIWFNDIACRVTLIR